MDFFEGVEEFNRRIKGIEPPREARVALSLEKEWIVSALKEELEEFRAAETPADQLDALIDLIYFAAGQVYTMGANGQAAFDAVHAANMTKMKGTLSKRPGPSNFDAVKPNTWKAPDLTEALKPRERQ